jgi:hypothetical protein
MKEPKPPEEPGSEDTMETRSSAMKKSKQAALGRDVQAKIGQQLRSYYDTLIEPPPDRFVELLRQLDKSDKKEGS